MNIYVTVGLEEKWHKSYDSFYCLITADQTAPSLDKTHDGGIAILSCRFLDIKQVNSFSLLSPISLLSQVLRASTWMLDKARASSIQYNTYLFSTHSTWRRYAGDAINSESGRIQVHQGLNVTMIPLMKTKVCETNQQDTAYYILCCTPENPYANQILNSQRALVTFVTIISGEDVITD